MNSSNYILWFVQADAGTITEEDIKFIKTLRQDIPMLIVVNKADKKNLSDLKDIITKIKSTLDIKVYIMLMFLLLQARWNRLKMML